MICASLWYEGVVKDVQRAGIRMNIIKVYKNKNR